MSRAYQVSPDQAERNVTRRTNAELARYDVEGRGEFGGWSDDELKADRTRCREALNAFTSAHTRRKEPMHSTINEFVESAQKRLEAALRNSHGDLEAGSIAVPLLEHAALLVEVAKGDKSELVKAWHASVDARDDYSPLTEADYQRQRAVFAREVDARDEELRLRPLRRAKLVAEQKLAEAEARG